MKKSQLAKWDANVLSFHCLKFEWRSRCCLTSVAKQYLQCDLPVSCQEDLEFCQKVEGRFLDFPAAKSPKQNAIQILFCLERTNSTSSGGDFWRIAEFVKLSVQENLLCGKGKSSECGKLSRQRNKPGQLCVGLCWVRKARSELHDVDLRTGSAPNAVCEQYVMIRPERRVWLARHLSLSQLI